MPSYYALLSLVLNYPLNIGVTLSNKAFFRVLSFQLPVTLAAIHMLFCAVLPRVLMRYAAEVPPELRSPGSQRRVWVLSLVWALHIAMSNIGLRWVSVHLFVLVKCAGPVSSALLSWILLGRSIVVGPALVVHAEVDVTFVGVAATVLVVLLTSLKVVVTTLLFSDRKVKWESLALLGEIAPKAGTLLLPWAWIEIYQNDARAQLGALGLYMIALLSASGVFAFLLNYNNFVMFKYMDSPVAVAVFTNVRKVLTIGASVLVFDHAIDSAGILGMLVTFSGVALYSWREIGASARAKAALRPAEIV